MTPEKCLTLHSMREQNQEDPSEQNRFLEAKALLRNAAKSLHGAARLAANLSWCHSEAKWHYEANCIEQFLTPGLKRGEEDENRK